MASQETMREFALESGTLILPEVAVFVSGIVSYLLSAFGWKTRWLIGLGVLYLALGCTLNIWLLVEEVSSTSFFFFNRVIGSMAAAVYVACIGYLCMGWRNVPADVLGEFAGSMAVFAGGCALAMKANDLIGLFVSLELVSMSVYFMLYIVRPSRRGQEAVLKYFLLSVFAGAFLAMGLAQHYGLSGATSYEMVGKVVQSVGPGARAIGLVAILFVVAGLAYRMAAVPMHFYAPDVYQGSATPSVAILAWAGKVVAYVVLARCVTEWWCSGGTRGDPLAESVTLVLWLLGMSSILVGSLAGLVQSELRRLLAYSGIMNSGFILIPIAAMCDASSQVEALKSLVLFIVSYGLLIVGLFATLTHIEGRGDTIDFVEELAGLAERHRGLALMILVFLLGLLGVPPTLGFWAKLNVFLVAWGTHRPIVQALGIGLLVGSVISAWYYLRIINVMYFRAAIKPRVVDARWSASLGVAIVCCAAVVGLFFGINGVAYVLERVVE
ncbi:MAG: hypothetical protein C4297_09700 [Gemmataceae bacterium]